MKRLSPTWLSFPIRDHFLLPLSFMLYNPTPGRREREQPGLWTVSLTMVGAGMRWPLRALPTQQTILWFSNWKKWNYTHTSSFMVAQGDGAERAQETVPRGKSCCLEPPPHAMGQCPAREPCQRPGHLPIAGLCAWQGPPALRNLAPKWGH